MYMIRAFNIKMYLLPDGSPSFPLPPLWQVRQQIITDALVTIRMLPECAIEFCWRMCGHVHDLLSLNDRRMLPPHKRLTIADLNEKESDLATLANFVSTCLDDFGGDNCPPPCHREWNSYHTDCEPCKERAIKLMRNMFTSWPSRPDMIMACFPGHTPLPGMTILVTSSSTGMPEVVTPDHVEIIGRWRTMHASGD